MRKNILVASFVFFGLVVCPAWALEGSLGFQGGVVGASRADGMKTPSVGVNGFAFLDFKLDPNWSLGLGLDLSDLIDGTDRLYVDGTELYARVTPWAGPWKPYFMAGAGGRLFYELDHNASHRWWPGDFQASAVVGVLHPLDEGIDLDLSVFYDLTPGTDSTLNSFGLRAGLAFDFGKAHSSVSASEAKPSAQPAVEEGSYKIHKGDNLWKISKEKARAGHRWKKIYDANHQVIKNPNLIYPSQEIAIPSPGKSADKTQDPQ